MARTNFESLEVYRRAEDLADALWEIVVHWDPFAKGTVGEQLVRAADSVPANLAEGSGRGTVRDKQRFVRIGRGSLYETQNWLRRAYRRKLLDEQQVDALKPQVDALAPMLNAYLRSIQ
jgi:four helix bundle protein